MTDLAIRDEAALLEQVLVKGDLSGLTPAQRLTYYQRICESQGLNPLTRPLEYLVLQGKTILYARKDCTDQLRDIKHVSIVQLEREQIGDLFVVTAYAQRGDRRDSEVGAVNVANLKGEALANAMMKAVTKAKRRVTLSICGLGVLDETEVETIPGARTLDVDPNTGEAYVPTDVREVEDADLIRSADDDLWKRWLKVLAEAQGLGVKVQEIRLPMNRSDLKAYGTDISAQIKQRKAQLRDQEAGVPA